MTAAPPTPAARHAGCTPIRPGYPVFRHRTGIDETRQVRTNRAPLELLLVEDDADIAAGIGDYLEAHGVSVDFAYTAAQARARLEVQTFDLLVLDVNLPDESGLSLCRSLKRDIRFGCPILFLTARDALDDKLTAFEAGAVDYMVKPFAPAELLARVRAIVAHAPADGGLHLHVGEFALDVQGQLLRRGDASLALHATGFALLHRLMQSSPACVSRSTLSALLWENGQPDSEPLRMHVYQLRQRLQRCFGQTLIHTVRGAGYRFVAEDDGHGVA